MTVALGTNIANPISTALSQWLGFDTMGKLANYGKLGVTDPDAVIKALFANSEVGAWYDPSDLTTMSQDRSGSTQVTADGQAVGLILDKSKGLVLGPELGANGTFDADLSGWDEHPSFATGTAEWVAGRLHYVGSGTRGLIGESAASASTFTAGKRYKVSMDIEVVSGNGPSVNINISYYGGVIIELNSAGFNNLPVGTYHLEAIAVAQNTGSGHFGFDNSIYPSGEWYLDNISVKELAGNHAVAPSDAARPLYKTDGTYHWLQFDGVNNSLSTAAINFTSTDKVGIFSGVKANTGNIDAYICGIGSAIGVNGSYHVFASLYGGGNKIYQVTNGTVDLSRGNVSITYPFTRVMASLFDNAQALNADQNKLRLNSSPSTLTYDIGPTSAGNYANAALNVGARGGVTGFLSGNIYSLIVLGRLATTQEITDTETWVNFKCGAY